MAKQQTKRRRKRYQPGSAYAGHVRPTGILGFLGSGRTMRVVFILMALALAGGGLAGVFGTTRGGGGGDTPLVDTEGDDGSGPTPLPDEGAQVKQYDGPPEMTIDTAKSYSATIKTALGDIQVELFDDQVPTTVNNFVFLARDGFYDDLTFHQANPGFAVQGGDPTGTGRGGPGYELEQEAPGAFELGSLGMANASQFFIALSDSERDLQEFQQFTPFGSVISGLEVAEQLEQGAVIETIDIQEE